MTEYELRELLQRQALGDEEATELLAAHMAGTGASANAWSQAQEWANQYRRDLLVKNDWEEENRDIRNDPEVYGLAVRLDSRLAEKRPDLELKQRLNLVTGVIREEVGDVEGFHNSVAIAQIAGTRQYHDHNGRSRVRQDERGNLEFDESPDAIGNELRGEDKMRSDAIGQMVTDRMRARQQAGLSAAEHREPVKPQRMFAHAPK